MSTLTPISTSRSHRTTRHLQSIEAPDLFDLARTMSVAVDMIVPSSSRSLVTVRSVSVTAKPTPQPAPGTPSAQQHPHGPGMGTPVLSQGMTLRDVWRWRDEAEALVGPDPLGRMLLWRKHEDDPVEADRCQTWQRAGDSEGYGWLKVPNQSKASEFGIDLDELAGLDARGRRKMCRLAGTTLSGISTSMFAHRVIYLARGGHLADGDVVRHLCQSNRLCVRHLMGGTRSDNTAELVRENQARLALVYQQQNGTYLP
ncbi:HNH endonuclease [Acidimicrobiia bacterium EGI L10123]|uniref:hypothetical protein n=1 Tax=Salinilacustrithrix flava TaxID=2957203 RepID=UPI003D7C32ED|nr:HNH endonuclease [Acidimicrobiia bacterium EGI L10123]